MIEHEKCPRCGRNIGKGLANCPHCGAVLNADPSRAALADVGVFILILGLLALAMFAVWSFVGPYVQQVAPDAGF